MDAKSYLMELTISCPFHSALDGCTLSKLREAPLTQLIEIMNKMSDEETDKMIKEHQECLQRRLNKLKVG